MKRITFRNNEPAKVIAGGAFRESTRVSPEALPAAVARRMVLDRMLASHCPPSDSLDQIQATDEPILRLMVQETIVTGCNPVVRKHAIAALSRFRSSDTINLVASLADQGEDEYVRSAAVHSLGNMTLASMAPIFVQGLRDSSALVRNAAAQSLVRLRDSLGDHVLTPHLAATPKGKAHDALVRILARQTPRRRDKARRTKRAAKRDRSAPG
jgi:HEAT repeat protein